VILISSCSSPDSGPAYDILDLADVTDVLVVNSTSQSIASDASQVLISVVLRMRVSALVSMFYLLLYLISFIFYIIECVLLSHHQVHLEPLTSPRR
jgi:hypothetical protein